MIRKFFPNVRVIENNCNNGFAAANNQAIKNAKGTYCLLLNNDAQLSPTTLNTFAHVFEENQDIAVITPQLISPNGDEQRSFGYFMRPMDEIIPKAFRKKRVPPTGNKLVDVDSVIGACMAVRQSAIQQVGLLDEDFFFYFEETQWCYRFKKHGFRIVLDNKTKVIHEKGKSTRSVRKEAQLEMLRSRFLYYKKVFNPLTALFLTTFRIARLIINMLFTILFLLISLGMHKKIRYRFLIYGYQLMWIILGKPRSWGLPNKCPVGYCQESSSC